MCRSCRALVPRGSKACPECGATLSDIAAPGVGRMFTNLFPGITAATSLIMLVNGFWFVMMVMAQIKAGGGLASFDLELLIRFGAGRSRPVIMPGGDHIVGVTYKQTEKTEEPDLLYLPALRR